MGEGNAVVVLDIYAGKDNLEIVGWREINENSLKQLKRQAEREGGQILILSPENGLAAGLSALPSDLSSLSKDIAEKANPQEGEGEIGIRNDDLGVRSDKSGVGNEESGVRSEKRAKVEGVRRSIEAFDEADRKLWSLEEDLFNSEDEDVDVKVERERRREARREAFGE